MHILLATTGYPPEHAGAGGRLHAMYRRLTAGNSSFTWSVMTKRRNAVAVEVAGPRQIFAFPRGEHEFSPALEGLSEAVWMRRRLAKGLLDSVDVVHAAGWSWATPILVQAARRRGIPIVRELTTPGDPGSNSLGGRFIRWINRQADEIVAISPALEQAARRAAPNVPIWCRPNGVDTNRFCPADNDKRARGRAALREWLPGLKVDDVVVLQIGRIRPLKNQLFLAESVARLPAKFHLLFIGPVYHSDDSYVAALRRRLAEPDLRSRVALIEDAIPDVERFMQAADILAFPSAAEGLGTVMIEALCCGLPVVASRLPGVTDWVVSDGENGFLAPLDREQFAARLTDAEALISSQARIAAAAGKSYDQGNMDAGYRELFERLHAHREDAGPDSSRSVRSGFLSQQG